MFRLKTAEQRRFYFDFFYVKVFFTQVHLKKLVSKLHKMRSKFNNAEISTTYFFIIKSFKANHQNLVNLYYL